MTTCKVLHVIKFTCWEFDKLFKVKTKVLIDGTKSLVLVSLFYPMASKWCMQILLTSTSNSSHLAIATLLPHSIHTLSAFLQTTAINLHDSDLSLMLDFESLKFIIFVTVQEGGWCNLVYKSLPYCLKQKHLNCLLWEVCQLKKEDMKNFGIRSHMHNIH